MEWKLLLIAIATSTSLHAALEPDNVMTKLHRLKNAIKTGKIDELQFKGIDTRAKSYAVGMAFLIIPSAIIYFVAKAIDPSAESAMKYTTAILLISSLVLMVKLDRYHVEIEKMTQAHKK